MIYLFIFLIRPVCKRPRAHLRRSETRGRKKNTPEAHLGNQRRGARGRTGARLRQRGRAPGAPPDTRRQRGTDTPCPEVSGGVKVRPATPYSPAGRRTVPSRPIPGRAPRRPGPPHSPRAGLRRPRVPWPRRRAPHSACTAPLLPIGPRPPPAPWLTGAAANRKS